MTGDRARYAIVAIAAIAVIATAGALYLKVSSRADSAPATGPHPTGMKEAATPANTVPPAAIPSIEVAAEKLARRLQTEDGSADDWALLARSYVHMRRYAEADAAFGRALQKLPGDPRLLEERAAARKAAGVAPK